MPGDSRLREIGKRCDQFSGRAFAFSQEVEDFPTVPIRYCGKHRVVSSFAPLAHCDYDQEDFEGSWLIEKRFPSGSEKVAEIPQAYSPG